MADFEIYRKEKIYYVHEVVIKWIVDIIMIISLSYLCTIFFLGKAVAVGHSMDPVLLNNDNILIDKVSYCFNEPERYDIVVFEPSVANVSKYYIKRIIGLPGETVQIIDGFVYINGELLTDDIIYRRDDDDKKDSKEDSEEQEMVRIYNAGLASEPILLGYDEYFVLGDNRNNSEDSRFSNVGNVKISSIIGKAWAVSAPFGRIGLIK